MIAAMRNHMKPRRVVAACALPLALVAASTGALALTDADYDRAKKNYTFEDLQADALCGDNPTIVWRGGSAAIERGFVNRRQEAYDKAPEGKEILNYYPAKVDQLILGMRFAGVADPSQPSDSVKLAFAAPAAEVFAKLPKAPKMVKTDEVAGVTKWQENKATLPRLVAFSYKNYTDVMCQRPQDFVAKVR